MFLKVTFDQFYASLAELYKKTTKNIVVHNIFNYIANFPFKVDQEQGLCSGKLQHVAELSGDYSISQSW